MQTHGWGNYPIIEAEVFKPLSLLECGDIIKASSLIPRGMGRSYGDSANAQYILQTTYLDHFIDFDAATGTLTCESGVTLREILNLVVPKGWFLPVTPGTSLVTIGGSIASDVHGKNHHIVGTFTQHVSSLTMLLGSGEIVKTSSTEKSDLFHATCGGMGLTGVILRVTLQLKPICSSNIKRTTLKADCLDAIGNLFEEYQHANYSVAWVDCLAKGKNLGRSVLMLGEHAQDDVLEADVSKAMTVPIYMPSKLLNKWTVKSFNSLYYAKASHKNNNTMPFQPYFYPLDNLNDWNKLYGTAGFTQYQFVLPKEAGILGMRQILMKISESGTGSFLAVLKMFGAQNENLLSFPVEGLTLALDFKMNAQTKALIHELDAMVVDWGGRIYLAKDALMSEQTFKSTYPRWQEFERVREIYGAIGHFASKQSQRLGLL